MSNEVGKIYAAMAAIQKDIGSIAKTDLPGAPYKRARTIDSIIEKIHGVLVSNEVFILPQVEDIKVVLDGKGIILKNRYRFMHADGSFVEAVVSGQGSDSGDKASNKAMSSAFKYLIAQTFTPPFIKQDDSDTDPVPPPAAPVPPTVKKKTFTESVEGSSDEKLLEIITKHSTGLPFVPTVKEFRALCAQRAFAGMKDALSEFATRKADTVQP